MKRHDLVRHLRTHGCELLRDLQGSGDTAAVAVSMMSRDNDRLTRHKDRDPIPDEFASVSEAGEFWDTHDLTDYEDQTREADFKVDLPPPHTVKKSPPKP